MGLHIDSVQPPVGLQRLPANLLSKHPDDPLSEILDRAEKIDGAPTSPIRATEEADGREVQTDAKKRYASQDS